LLELDRALEDVIPFLFALLGLQGGDDPMARMDMCGFGGAAPRRGSSAYLSARASSSRSS
jgi:hypothetical protein